MSRPRSATRAHLPMSLPRSLPRSLAAIALAGLLSGGVALAGPAGAAAYTARDAAHDVVAEGSSTGVDGAFGGETPVPHDAATDLTYLTTTLTSTRLTLTAHTLAALPRTKFEAAGVFRTAGSGSWAVLLERFGSKTRTFLLRGQDGHRVACKHLGGAVDRTKDTVTLRVPVSCLDDASYVRTGFLVGTHLGNYSEGSDGPHFDQMGRRSLGNGPLHYGPKVQQG